MKHFVLSWRGPYLMTQETPKQLRGKKGLYAIVHDSKILYIGKAEHGNAVFREAKSHYGKYAETLKQLNIIPESMSRKDAYKYVFNKCRIFTGVTSSDDDIPFIDSAEKLIIFRLRPHGNTQSLQSYIGVRPLKILNNGKRPQCLPLEIQCITSGSVQLRVVQCGCSMRLLSVFPSEDFI